jgi:hypothetical protein
MRLLPLPHISPVSRMDKGCSGFEFILERIQFAA